MASQPPPDLSGISDTLNRFFASMIEGGNLVSQSFNALARVATQATTSIGVLTSPFRALGETLSLVGKGVEGLTKGAAQAAAAAGGAGGTGGSSGGPEIAALGSVVLAATSAFEQLVGVAQKLVAVSNPQVAFQFNRALLDLQATVGTAFAPFLSILTEITRQIAGELFPVMKQLAPFFGLLGSVVGTLLVPIFQRIGIVMEALEPVLSFFLEYWTDLNAVFQAVQAVQTALMKTVVQLVQSLFAGISLKTVFEAMRTATVQCITALLQFSIRLASLFGVGEQFKRNLLEALQPNKDFAHAPTQASTEGILGIVQKLNEASAVAVGMGGAAERKFDFKDVVDAINATDATTLNLGPLIQTAISNAVAEILKHLPQLPDAFDPTAAGGAAAFGGLATGGAIARGLLFGGS